MFKSPNDAIDAHIPRLKIEGSGPLLLASASPRRAELLRAAGIRFEVRAASVDEAVRPGEDAESYVRRVAKAKANAIWRNEAVRVVLGADTVVVVDGQILGKPTDMGDARRMLGLLSGRTHEVLTAVCLLWPSAEGPEDPRAAWARPGAVRVVATKVEFAPLTAEELDWYLASGEPLDKAGAYAIQGLASRFVTRIEGSYSNVVGLPLSLLYRMCNEAGILVS